MLLYLPLWDFKYAHLTKIQIISSCKEEKRFQVLLERCNSPHCVLCESDDVSLYDTLKDQNPRNTWWYYNKCYLQLWPWFCLHRCSESIEPSSRSYANTSLLPQINWAMRNYFVCMYIIIQLFELTNNKNMIKAPKIVGGTWLIQPLHWVICTYH